MMDRIGEASARDARCFAPHSGLGLATSGQLHVRSGQSEGLDRTDPAEQFTGHGVAGLDHARDSDPCGALVSRER